MNFVQNGRSLIIEPEHRMCMHIRVLAGVERSFVWQYVALDRTANPVQGLIRPV